MDVRLYFKRKERDEECQARSAEQRKMQGGALGGANIITALLFFSGDNTETPCNYYDYTTYNNAICIGILLIGPINGEKDRFLALCN